MRITKLEHTSDDSLGLAVRELALAVHDLRSHGRSDRVRMRLILIERASQLRERLLLHSHEPLLRWLDRLMPELLDDRDQASSAGSPAPARFALNV